MAWFAKLCRNTGLMIHHAIKPIRPEKQHGVVNRTVQEKKVSSTTTLRRTTIDEIEVSNRSDDTAKDK